MIAHLESDAAVKPTTVASAVVPEGGDATGLVTSTIVEGELFLHPQGHKDQRFRLRWSADDTERARSLPAGVYKVTGYRNLHKSDDGATWIWAASAPAFRELEVKVDATTHCEVSQTLEVNTRAVFKKGKHRVGMGFQAEKRLGHTLYRDGKRIAIRWQCLDAQGEVLAEGAMRYG